MTTNSTDAMLFTPVLRYESDDDLLYLPTSTPTNAQLAALADKLEAVAATEPSDLYRLLTPRIAAIGRSTKGSKFQVQTAPIVEVSEADMMAMDLECMRLGLIEPLQTLTDEQLEEIENEHIGSEHDFF